MSEQILDQENKSPAIIHVEPREAVKELLSQLKAIRTERGNLSSQLDQAVLDLIEICDNKAEIIEKEIKELVSFEVQETIKINDGCASFRPGTKRVTYDRKTLDAIKGEKIRKAIDPARKETQVKGSVIVEVY